MQQGTFNLKNSGKNQDFLAGAAAAGAGAAPGAAGLAAAAGAAALALASSLGAGNLTIAAMLNKEASTKVAKLINDFFHDLSPLTSDGCRCESRAIIALTQTLWDLAKVFFLRCDVV